jgi:hypothetical protein
VEQFLKNLASLSHDLFCSSAQVLGEEQTKFIKEVSERIMKMLQETPPDGPKFAETIQVFNF